MSTITFNFEVKLTIRPPINLPDIILPPQELPNPPLNMNLNVPISHRRERINIPSVSPGNQRPSRNLNRGALIRNVSYNNLPLRNHRERVLSGQQGQINPAAIRRPVEPIKREVNIGLVEPIRRDVNLGPVEPIRRVVNIGPVEPSRRDVNLGPIEPSRRVINRRPVEPIRRDVNLGPVEPSRRDVNIGPVEPSRRDVNIGPVEPIRRDVNIGPVEPIRRVVNIGPVEPIRRDVNIRPVEPIRRDVNIGPVVPIRRDVNIGPVEPIRREVQPASIIPQGTVNLENNQTIRTLENPRPGEPLGARRPDINQHIGQPSMNQIPQIEPVVVRPLIILNQNNFNNQIDINNNLEDIEITEQILNKSNTKTCVICQQDYNIMEKICYLPCFHFYHSQCIRQWVQTSNICPICKNEINFD